jgi:iron-only hydrogenase group A
MMTAPAVRAALGEEFGMPIGTGVEGKMVASLRRLGADKVFDIDFGADVTIVEEATELLNRVKNGGVLPMITSCSPGWVRFCEQYYPNEIDHLSSCKSPMQMTGALIKTWYAEKEGIDPKDIYVVAVMPCTAKKMEAEREEFVRNGKPDIDAVITTKELAKMIRELGIQFNEIEPSAPDQPFSIRSGAGVIFGASGGVTEAALRRVAERSNSALTEIRYSGVRGLEGIKTFNAMIGEKDVRVAVVSGLANAEALIQLIESGEEHFDFVEVMACPTGCIGGAGQPEGFLSDKEARAAGLYTADKSALVKRSDENPVVQQLYETGLLKDRAHELLHVHYCAHHEE